MAGLEERVQALEREHRKEWKDVIQRLARIEASNHMLTQKIDMLCERDNHSIQNNQSRQQDRWSGALWIGGWTIATALLAAVAVVALLSYLS